MPGWDSSCKTQTTLPCINTHSRTNRKQSDPPNSIHRKAQTQQKIAKKYKKKAHCCSVHVPDHSPRAHCSAAGHTRVRVYVCALPRASSCTSARASSQCIVSSHIPLPSPVGVAVPHPIRIVSMRREVFVAWRGSKIQMEHDSVYAQKEERAEKWEWNKSHDVPAQSFSRRLSSAILCHPHIRLGQRHQHSSSSCCWPRSRRLDPAQLAHWAWCCWLSWCPYAP